MPRLTARAKQALTEDRRAQILTAAEAVFSDRGYHGATIHEIAERAGLAEGTIYLYFASKRDLLLATWDQVALSSLVPLLQRGPGDDDDETFMATLLADRFEMIRRHAVFMRLVLHQADLDRVFQRSLQHRIEMIKTTVGGHLRRRVAEGRFRPVDIPIALRAISGMMVGIALLDAHDPDPLFPRHSTRAVAREVARLILSGLAAGRKQVPRRPGQELRTP
jgi:AcrR family transcriptional regulator